MPQDVIAVSESGLQDARTICSGCAALGYRAFLIGERFMTAADPGAALAALLAAAGAVTRMIVIKICGITRLEDAEAAVELRRRRARVHLLAGQPALHRSGSRARRSSRRCRRS